MAGALSSGVQQFPGLRWDNRGQIYRRTRDAVSDGVVEDFFVERRGATFVGKLVDAQVHQVSLTVTGPRGTDGGAHAPWRAENIACVHEAMLRSAHAIGYGLWRQRERMVFGILDRQVAERRIAVQEQPEDQQVVFAGSLRQYLRNARRAGGIIGHTLDVGERLGFRQLCAGE